MSVTFLKSVSVAHLSDWISRIDFADWPQQHRLEDDLIRPSMVTDLAWHGFGVVTESVVADCLTMFPGCTDSERMLSVVMPGHHIPPHTDKQNERWRCRVHIPLLTNAASWFIVDGVTYQMEVGSAYCVDTRQVHEVRNDGAGPRVHLMMDVVGKVIE